MHLAMNDSIDSINASFDVQEYLIAQKIDYHCLDNFKRTPLHFAFKKINKVANKEVRDPIEVISSILSIKDLNIN